MSLFNLNPELASHLDGCVLDHPALKFDHAWPAFFGRLNHAFEIATSYDRTINLNDHNSAVQKRYWKYLQAGIRDDATHYRDFGEFWTHPELIGLTSDCVVISTDASHRNRSEIMTVNERSYLAALPDEFKLYRAHNRLLRNRCCWTLDYEIARIWAVGLPENNQISTGIGYKCDVIAYIARRGESEVLMPAETVRIVETVNAG